MDRIGPQLEPLLHRVSETPDDFLRDPLIASTGLVYLPAVVQDLLVMLDSRLPAQQLLALEGHNPKTDRNRQIVQLIFCWLLCDNWFIEAGVAAKDVLSLLQNQARDLAEQVTAAKIMKDPDRREEIVRLSLAKFGYRPQGESLAQAQDRLTSLSSIERARILEVSRAAEERAREVRIALARKRAQEAADKWTRE
jgi:hypothetical protein